MSNTYGMSQEDYDALWKCKYCDEWFVVPSLARDHEENKCYCRPVEVHSAA